jgi:hypothetical protein
VTQRPSGGGVPAALRWPCLSRSVVELPLPHSAFCVPHSALKPAPLVPAQNRPRIPTHWLLTYRPPAANIAPCLVRPKTNSPSPAQRSVQAGAQTRGWRNRGHDLMAICHDARKGRYRASHWSKPVAPPLHSTSPSPRRNSQALLRVILAPWQTRQTKT